MAGERKRRLSLSGWIFVAFGAGIACGLFFGERTAFLQVLATGFIRLLQMAVLPYVTVSLVAGLGSLSYREAGFIARQGGLLLLLMWALTFSVLAALPLAYPDWESASFFSTTLVEPRQGFDFVSLYIPANPFNSLSENAVPAVVLFCIAVGVALIGVSGREVLLENLHVLSKALARITSFVVRLTPVGVFAIAASAAGTLTIEDFGRLQVYVFTYVTGALLVSFWVLPGLVAALTPVRYRDVLRASRDALVTAFSTGSTFVVLPLLADCAKRLLEGVDDSEEAEAVVDVIVPVTFNFPNAGRLFALAFVVFAAWFAGSAIPVSQYPTLAITGLFSLFGSVNVAVPFLFDLFRVPADMFQLFLAVGILDSRFATLLAAMHILALAVMGTCAVRGRLVVQWAKLGRYLLVTLVLGAVSLGGVRWYLGSVLQGDYRKYTLITERSLSEEPARAVVRTELPGDMTPRAARGSRLDRIRASGVLRVGYASGSLPFAYFNAAGALVGFDVEMAHRLAKDLGASLELVPFDYWKLAEHLGADHFDVAMTGVAIAADRSQEMAFTTPIMDVTFAFFVKDHRRQQFSTRESVQKLEDLRIGAPVNPYYRAKVREYLPDAELVSIDSLEQYVEEYGDDLDAAVGAAEGLAAWTLLHPQFSVAVPQPDPFRAPMAYPVARGDQELVNFLNDWIELKRKDNTIDALYRYWILGRDEVRREPRWSVIRDVLHWVD